MAKYEPKNNILKLKLKAISKPEEKVCEFDLIFFHFRGAKNVLI